MTELTRIYCAIGRSIIRRYSTRGVNKMNVEHINPFVTATKDIIKQVCQIEVNLGTPRLSVMDIDGPAFMVSVGITGQVRGIVTLELSEEEACALASAMMMGMPVDKIDDMSRSALCELSNMIMGTASTLLSSAGYATDITPPTSMWGDNMKIATSDTKTICVPIEFKEGLFLDLNIAVKAA